MLTGIRKAHPLKQGLKPVLGRLEIEQDIIRKAHPLKQGLKQEYIDHFYAETMQNAFRSKEMRNICLSPGCSSDNHGSINAVTERFIA